MAQVSYGTITITDTNDIEKIYMEYAQSQNNQTAPTTGWDDDIPTWREGYYIWQRTVTKMSGVPLSQDSYGEPVCLTGSTGSSGAPGQSVDSIVTSYCNYGTGTPAATYSGWQSAVPAYDSTKPNYWIKTVITYSNPTTTDTKIYKDNGITSATSTAAAANTTAQNAKDKADDAWDKADNAETIASNANTAISDLNQYFWRKKSASTNVPAGSYVTNIPGTTYQQDPTNGGFNSLVQANGIFLRNGIATLSSWTGDALTFYHPTNSGQGNRGMELSSSTLKFYDSTGTVAQATFGGTQATVSGTINVYDGKIGNASNYWYIGNYTDYNQNDSAIIKSIGTASIQLNETNTWRIATNRIHTAWAPATGTDAYKLHFPIYVDSENTNRHWDYGLHLPTSYSDKFLYIRNAASSETLDNLLDDLDDAGYNYWNYIFYIDGSGNLHAGDIYSHGTLISGTSAPYLLKSGGTMTGNITMSNGAKLVGDVTGNVTGNVSGSAGKLSNTSKIGDTNKPVYFSANGVPVAISYEINKSVPSNALFTDQNVRSTQANTTKLWLVGTPTSGDRTGELNYDSNIYADTTAGALHATTFNGYTLAAASAKGVDTSLTTSTTSTNLPTSAAVVNLIKQYLPLTGGNVTGAVTFGSSVSIDELTAGDLVVNGAASFTNNLQANTINGIVVGNNPKFTDTVTTVTVTGSGNAITSMTASNGAITATKGSTFLTSESDPVFVASAAHGITSNDISNWNSKTSNTGTVTSVRVQASSPLQSSVSTAQNASLNTTISFINQDANTVLAGPASGSTAAAPTFRKLVAADIPDISGTYYLANNPNGYTTNVGTVTKVIAGTGLAIGTTAQGNFTTSGTINHTNSVTAKTAAAQSAKTLTFGDTFTLYEEKYDAQGHITGVASYNMTMPANPDTHYTANLITGASATAKANAAASTNGNVYLNLVENSTVRNSHNIVGSGTVTVTSDANGKITISGTAHPTSLKNPNALAIKIYNGTSTSSDTNYDGSVANQSISVAGTNAITGINSTSDGKLQLTLADGSQPTPVAIKITATTSDSAASADKLNLSANIGSSTRPVYFDANTGLPVAIDYTIQSNVPQNAKFTDTWTAMVGATSSANGSVGYVNAVPPKDGYNTKFLRADGTWVVPGGTYSLPLAANGTRGGVQIGYTQSGKNYPVQLNSEKMYVNVPWTDTTYTAGTGLSLSGTTFNHSNSVTAGTAGTSSATSSTNRTISVPYVTYDAQGHITGSGTHTHTIDTYPEAYLAWGGRNITGDLTPVGMSISTEHSANRIAFLNPDAIQIEYTTNGGSIWADSGYNNTEKMWLCTGSQGIAIGQSKAEYSASTALTINNWTRITLTGQNGTTQYVYTNPRKLLVNMSTALGVECLIEYKTGVSNATWQTFGTYTVSGWSGWNDIPLILGTFGGGTNQTGNNWYLRFTFKVTSTRTDNYKGMAQVYGLRLFGTNNWGSASSNNGKGVISATGHLYNYDSAANATFPAQVTATQFNGPLNGNAASATKATNDVDGNPIKTTYAKLSGATFTGAINTANGTYNKIGDDVQIGDINVAGTLGIKGINGRTGIRLVAYSGSTNTDIYNDGAGNLTITGTVLSTFFGNLTGNVTGNVTGTASGNVTSVQYDSTNTKFTYTKNGSNTDIVTIANLKTYLGLKALAYKDSLGKSDVGLGNVDNTADANKRVKGANITTTANAVAYYTDTTGTFGSKASADGVLYATAANGTLNWGTLPVAQGGTGATTAANARTNLGLGSAATYTAATSVGNNSNLPTGAAIQTYVSGVVGNYVTIAGDNEIITGTKSFNNILGMKYVAAKSGFGCEIGYNSTLDALVFSFA